MFVYVLISINNNKIVSCFKLSLFSPSISHSLCCCIKGGGCCDVETSAAPCRNPNEEIEANTQTNMSIRTYKHSHSLHKQLQEIKQEKQAEC